jgi:DNA-binding beta-propeller fold protein YncE
LNEPYDTVVLPDGTWIVAEAGAKQLTAIAPDGTRSVWAKDFERPVGLALGPSNALFVTDRAAGTLTAIDTQTLKRRVIVKDLNAPEGLVVLADGTVAVLATGSRDLFSYDVITGDKNRIATNFALGHQTETFFAPHLGQPADARLFNGVALGADGTLYVGSDIQTALYALRIGSGPASFMAMIRSLTSKVFR